MQSGILKSILSRLELGKPSALVCIIEDKGSSPGKTGAMMAVFDDGQTLGTVGGGSLEHYLKNKAIEALKSGKNAKFSFNLNDPEIGMACGGFVEGHITIFHNRNKLLLIGAGHVCQCVAKAASDLNFDIYVQDDRDEFIPKFLNIKKYITESADKIDRYIDIDAATYVVIATRGHELDYQAAKFALQYNTAYLGIIGSKNKLSNIKKMLTADGLYEEKLNKIYAPIGLDISDGTPEEIAISILSEILAVKNSKNPVSRSIFRA